MFQSHSKTSHEAYDGLTDESGQLDEVIKAFTRLGASGGTCEEAHEILKDLYPHWQRKPYGSVSARMTTLKRNGSILWSGETRKTKSNRPAEVWVIKADAKPEYFSLTAEKLKSDKDQVIEAIANAQRLLEAMIKANAASGCWPAAIKHNVVLLEKAQSLLQ